MGATFDPSALYRFNAVRRMLDDNGLTTARISAHVARLQARLLEALGGTRARRGASCSTRSTARPTPASSPSAAPNAQRWYAELKAQNCITDVRGDVLRIGFGLYQDEADVDALRRSCSGGLT